MSGSQTLSGQCLCGAVTVTATAQNRPRLRACHCDMCRRHNSGMFLSIELDQDGLAINGPVEVFKSSDWAQRAFCRTCGSTIYYGTIADGVRNLAAGLFPDAGGGALKIEFFADKCPQGYRLAGDHRRLSAAETIAMFEGQP